LVYLDRIRVKFIHEGHRVKVKVTTAKKGENPYFCSVKLSSAVTLVLLNTHYGRSNGVTTVFVA